MKEFSIKDKLKIYDKFFVFEQYTRIVYDFKQYDNISKAKMLEAIYKEYSNPQNIIDICTTRELKLLEGIINNEDDNEIYTFKHERLFKSLQDKFLISFDDNGAFIPPEIYPYIKQALTIVDYKKTREKDRLNEVLVGFCQTQGTALMLTAIEFVSNMLELDKDIIQEHIYTNKLFNYYVMIDYDYVDIFDEELPILVYQDYFYIKDKIGDRRSEEEDIVIIPYIFDKKYYKNIFYNGFDTNNKKINKLVTKLKLMTRKYMIEDAIKFTAMLNDNRDILKEYIKDLSGYNDDELKNFYSILDEAMDEMPSGVLNGFSPNQVKERKAKNNLNNYNKAMNFIKQENASLSKKDKDLFYKLYFGLLDYTNTINDIIPGLKIYGKLHNEPEKLTDIINYLWEHKDTIIDEFIKENPFNFNEEELTIVDNFKKGIRAVFIIVSFEDEYTTFMYNDKIYMVKGLNGNIDEIVSYKDIPTPVLTTLLPFKEYIVYDGILLAGNTNLGYEFEKTIKEIYDDCKKYYHL